MEKVNNASAGGSGFGEMLMLSEGKLERIGIGVIPMTLPLVWPTIVPEECWGIEWEVASANE